MAIMESDSLDSTGQVTEPVSVSNLPDLHLLLAHSSDSEEEDTAEEHNIIHIPLCNYVV